MTLPHLIQFYISVLFHKAALIKLSWIPSRDPSVTRPHLFPLFLSL